MTTQCGRSFNPSTHYQCAMCGEIYKLVRDETWSEEKAQAELEQNFPGFDKSDCARVCDDCYNHITTEYPPEQFMAGQ